MASATVRVSASREWRSFGIKANSRVSLEINIAEAYQNLLQMADAFIMPSWATVPEAAHSDGTIALHGMVKKRLIKRLSEFLLLASVRIAYTELASHARSLEGGLP
ncbi:hypothetical protein [Acidithiobacillus ferriphilus]|uniref:hypothetical protein n=1 Tax=Acidithiobacillus ferriphilus TaxID=1689834 RepID=UPI0040568EBD